MVGPPPLWTSATRLAGLDAPYDTDQDAGLQHARRGPVASWLPGLWVDGGYWLIFVTLVDQFPSNVRVPPQLPIGVVRY